MPDLDLFTNSYGFNIDGSLIPADDENLIRYASEGGVAPLLVVTPINESGTYSYELLKEVFTNPRMRERFINNIVLTVIEKNYYGAVFNFGSIATEDGEQFVITVSKTAARLNRAANFIELRAADSSLLDPGKILLPAGVEAINEMFTVFKV